MIQINVDRSETSFCDERGMFRHSSLFRSRWLALLWSLGVLWSAASFVGSADSDGGAANAASGDGGADLNQMQALVGKLES